MISACGGFQLIRRLNMGDGVDTTQKQKIRMKDKVGFFPTPIRSGKYVVKNCHVLKVAKIKHGRGLKNMATGVVPVTDHIILKAVEAEEITTSGLVIPDSAKEAPQHGHVVAVGPGRPLENGEVQSMDDIKAGDRVLYQKYTGQDVSVDSEDYIIIRYQDVLAKLED